MDDYKKNIIKTSKLLGAGAILIGLIVLSGWVFDIESFRTFSTKPINMNPVTAMVSILIGIIIVFYKENEENKIVKAVMVSGMVTSLTIGIVTIINTVGRFGNNLDNIFFADKISSLAIDSESRIVFNASLGIILISSALLLIYFRIGYKLANVFAFVCFILGWMGVLGILYDVEQTFSESLLFARVSFSTSLIFLFASIALLLMCSDKGFVELIANKTLAGSTLKILITFSFILNAILGLFILAGINMGSFPIDLGILYFVTLNSVIFLCLFYYSGTLISNEENKKNKSDALFKAKTIELEKSKTKLELNVKDLENTEKAVLNILEDLQLEKIKVQQQADDLVKYELAIKNASDHIVITDTDGKILFANPAVEKITGFSTEEIMGKKAGSKELWGGLMSKEFYAELWDQIKVKKKQFSGEITNKRKNGDIYISQSSISPILDSNGDVVYFLGVERDVTAEKKNIETLARMAAIVRDTEDAIISEDLSRIVTSWNSGAENLYGYTSEEIVGKSLKLIYPEEKYEEFENIGKEIAQGNKIEKFITQRKRKDGSIVDVSITTSPLRGKDEEVIGSSTIARDYTKEMQIDKAKTEFVSLASHQLRTPLSAINWYTEMLLSGDGGKITAQQKDFLEEIYNGNKRMVDLVNSLLNVSRIDLGTFAIEPIPTNIIEISDSIIKEMQPLVEQKKMKLNAKYEKDIPEINVDPKLIRIVFQNLVSNAVKYTPEKGSVDITIEKDAKNLNIQIADTGYGIPKEQQSKIFVKLFRADNIRDKVADGTGLGLYIVKAILDQSGGNIRFESVENKGTTFYVQIPLSGMKVKEGTKGLS